VKIFGTQEVAKKHFGEVVKILNELKSMGYKCAIDSGTLLGYTREGQVISHDHDYDIVVFVEGYSLRDKIREFKKIRKHFTKKERNLKSSMHIQIEREFNVDIFVGFEYYGKTFIYPHLNGMPSEEYFPLKEVDLYDQRVTVPNNCELYCEMVYGEEWGISNKDWVYDWSETRFPLFEDFKFIYKRTFLSKN